MTHNLSGSAGIAVATALAVSLLGGMVLRDAIASPAISPALIEQVQMDKVDFIPNSRLDDVLAATTATPAEIDAAVKLYEDARLRSLRTTMMLLAALALLAVVPAGKLPNLRDTDDELSVEDFQTSSSTADG